MLCRKTAFRQRTAQIACWLRITIFIFNSQAQTLSDRSFIVLRQPTIQLRSSLSDGLEFLRVVNLSKSVAAEKQLRSQRGKRAASPRDLAGVSRAILKLTKKHASRWQAKRSKRQRKVGKKPKIKFSAQTQKDLSRGAARRRKDASVFHPYPHAPQTAKVPRVLLSCELAKPGSV